MSFNVIADGAIKGALEQSLPLLFGNYEQEIAVVQLELVDGSRQLRSKFNGLDEALRLAPTGNPIVILGLVPIHMVADDPRFQGVMGYPNVVFGDTLRLPQAALALAEMLENPRPRNEVAIRLAGLKVVQEEIGTLKHDLYHVRHDENRKPAWLARARNVFGDLSFEELAEKTQAWTYGGAKPFEGEQLNGCFIDIEGTLVQNGEIVPEIAALIQEKSATMPVNLWTDGDIKSLTPIIRKAGIYTNIVPKSLLSGATIEEAHDDLEESEFAKRYDIWVAKYRKV